MRKLICLSILVAVSLVGLSGCTTYSGPGGAIKKSAVYDAQDRAFRGAGN